MPDADEEIVTTPKTSMFEDSDHIYCCFNPDLMLCGIVEPGPWEWLPEGANPDEVTCSPCKALMGTGYCPLSMDCDTWIDIRNQEAGFSKPADT